jgi:hypothetical protein
LQRNADGLIATNRNHESGRERHEANVLVGAEKRLRSRYRLNILRKRLEDPERRHIEAAALELLVTAGYKLAGGEDGRGQ